MKFLKEDTSTLDGDCDLAVLLAKHSKGSQFCIYQRFEDATYASVSINIEDIDFVIDSLNKIRDTIKKE